MKKAMRDKKLGKAYLYWFPLGIFGAHHAYLGNRFHFIAYLFTFGLAGVGWLVDLIRMPSLVKKANLRQENRLLPTEQQEIEKFSLGEAYLFWFPMGILGLHHMYLQRYRWGFLYLITFGLMGVGWLVDGCQLATIVEEAQRKRAKVRGEADPYDTLTAYKLCFPLGFLGLHRCYLGQWQRGCMYFFSFGCFLVGWIRDCARMNKMVEQANREYIQRHVAKQSKHIPVGIPVGVRVDPVNYNNDNNNGYNNNNNNNNDYNNNHNNHNQDHGEGYPHSSSSGSLPSAPAQYQSQYQPPLPFASSQVQPLAPPLQSQPQLAPQPQPQPQSQPRPQPRPQLPPRPQPQDDPFSSSQVPPSAPGEPEEGEV